MRVEKPLPSLPPPITTWFFPSQSGKYYSKWIQACLQNAIISIYRLETLLVLGMSYMLLGALGIYSNWTSKKHSFDSINSLLYMLDNSYETFEMIMYVWYNMVCDHKWNSDLVSTSCHASLQQSVTVGGIWLKYEIKHLPGGVWGTSGHGDIFGFDVTFWDTWGAGRENSDHESCGLSISQSRLT